MSGENKKKPVQTWKSGVLEVALWEQEGKTKNGQATKFFTISSQRSYLDGTEWKKTNTLRANDLPVMTMLYNKAFEFVKMNGKEND